MHLFHISKIYAMFWCQILLIQFHSCNSESEFLQFRPPAFGGEKATGTEPWLSYWCGFEEFHTCVYQNVLFDTPSSKRTLPLFFVSPSCFFLTSHLSHLFLSVFLGVNKDYDSQEKAACILTVKCVAGWVSHSECLLTESLRVRRPTFVIKRGK